MSRLSMQLRSACAADLFYSVCARRIALRDHECLPHPGTGALIDWVEALKHYDVQPFAKFVVVPLCWLVSYGEMFSKDINAWISLNRASSFELFRNSVKSNLREERERLNDLYGHCRLALEEQKVIDI